ncbi:MAG: glycosyltransferase family 2 protein [Clostridia bacterium]|nr:glycosyltransferase family 2 protein [Clostridia bacterium]NDO18130.1 glycosyltransferase family 2 protein [Lachnospiraceae bacterium MD329]
MNKSVNLYIVVPCYNEEEVLNETSRQMLELFDKMKKAELINNKSRIVFVDDGSKDRTWNIIDTLAREHTEIAGIKLAHNAGHQNALFGGLMTVKDQCDCAISIDADLQDDINVIPEMVRKYKDGCDVVYGVRNRRDTDTFFKRTTAVMFYKLMRVMGVNIVFNHADYRLMSRRAIEALSEFEERNMFLRGMVPLVGYRSSCVYYDRNERFAGESKYPLKKMLSFAFDGITSFSISPIRMISAFGAIVCVIAVVMAVYALIEKLLGNTGAGWASLMMSIWFIGGVQLLSVGLIGEYIGKMYKEVKRRPRFIVEAYVNDGDES